FGPRLSVHLFRLWPAVSRRRCPAVDGQCGRRLRQRPLRELLRDARVRAARSTTLPDPSGRAPRHFRLPRRLVQPTPPPFCPRVPVPDEFRVDPRERRSLSALRSDDRPGGCYLPIPLGGGTVTTPKAVHPPRNRVNSSTAPSARPRWSGQIMTRSLGIESLKPTRRRSGRSEKGSTTRMGGQHRPARNRSPASGAR